MPKKLLNPYKMHRHWERRAHAWQHFFTQIFNGSRTPHRRDYSWAGRTANPYTEAIQRKRWWQITIIMVAILISIGLLLWHPVFTITHITVTGTARVIPSDIEQASLGIITRHRMLVLPGTNYFLVNLPELESILTQKFPLASARATKKFPSGIAIIVTEKKPALIYDNGREYSYVDDSGQVIQVMRTVSEEEWHATVKRPNASSTLVIAAATTNTTTSTLEVISRWHEPAAGLIRSALGPYPIIYDTRTIETKPGAAVLTETMVQGIKKWQTYLSATSSPGFVFLTIENELDSVTIKTRDGWGIKARLLASIEEQINNVSLVLKDPRTNRRQLRYIDVRYAGRVYWQ